MTMEFDFTKRNWLFTDDFGQVWRLTPSGDEQEPFIITLEKKPDGPPPPEGGPGPGPGEGPL